LERRLEEIERYRSMSPEEQLSSGTSNILANSINAAMDDVFGAGTADASDFQVSAHFFWANVVGPSPQRRLQAFESGLARARQIVGAAIERLRERQADEDVEDGGAVLRAYEGLDLHPEIARAASDLYRDGHYSNAIRDAVIALNDLVRMRSGEAKDGAPLMEFVFNPTNPILRFNDLADESDRNEQIGFMKMFSGAVAGLRNPRAHKLIDDDPERALEFIAFVSLLAKLVESATRVRPKS
jgi:uncharacterized protein (TIGR02391 family)